MRPIITIKGGANSRRVCLPLRDMTDCLLQAYDCVARRAYQKFLKRGGLPGGELDDWLNAEQELLGNLAVDVEDAGVFVSALASLPGLTSEDVDVGIDPRWLVILGRHSSVELAELEDDRVDDEQIAQWASAIHTDARILRLRSRRGTDFVPRDLGEETAAGRERGVANRMKVSASARTDGNSEGGKSDVRGAVPNDDAEKIARQERTFGEGTAHSHKTDPESRGPASPSQLFCILELPTEVDPAHCVAVLANGLLGIRMPKKPI